MLWEHSLRISRSLPRILSVHSDGMLGMEPAPELQALRGAHRRWTGIEVTPESAHVLDDLRGDALEIIAEWELGDATRFGINVRCSPDNTQETPIVFDHVRQRLIITHLQSSVDAEAERDMESGSFELRDGEPLKLHIFLDRSIVEVYSNGRACLTVRIYPSQPDSLGVDVFARDGSVHLKSLDCWEMNGIWTT